MELRKAAAKFSWKSGWYVWLFPLCALVISAWLLQDYYRKRGPDIRIYFEDAASLQAGRTLVRYRGVTIGIVRELRISEDNRKVEALVRLQRDAQHFAVKGSRFWVVSPQVNFQGVSGLETLLEGTYIAVHPGDPTNEKITEFDAQERSVTTEALENTTAYYLETPNAESIGPGDQVTFRGLAVGSVTKVTLARNSRLVIVQINIQNRYVKLVRRNTVFWRKAGIQAKLGLFNSEVKINSLETVLRGGIDLFTPDAAGPMAKAGARFPLAAAAPEGFEKWNPRLEFK